MTIDAGIRWEPFLPPVDNLNDQAATIPPDKTLRYYPTAPPDCSSPGRRRQCSLVKGIRAARARCRIAGRTSLLASASTSSPFPSGKTSVRLGYGVFWDQARLIAWNRFSTAQPFDASVIVNAPGSVANNYAPASRGQRVHKWGIQNPYPSSFLAPGAAGCVLILPMAATGRRRRARPYWRRTSTKATRNSGT